MSRLTLRQIANAIFARPNINTGGATYFDVLRPLMKTDTKSYEDMIKIFSHLHARSGPASVCEVVWGDGQLCISMKNAKRRWPDSYRRFLIAVAGFHEHSHSMFALNEMYFLPLLKWCYTIVGCAMLL